MEQITGKIAEIKRPYTVVINKGYDDGVEEGMRFVIYDEGEEIKDPDTHESLGNFEYVKAKVKVTYVHKKYSVADTYETYTYEPSLIGGTFADMLKPRTARVALPLGETQDQSADQSKKSIVNIGDLVRQILD